MGLRRLPRRRAIQYVGGERSRQHRRLARVNTAELAQCEVQIAKWVAKRDKLIREARREGLSLRAIADAAGISHTAVAKILAR